MKIIAIGDIHGRDSWKSICEANDFDVVVFIGDYFDTRDGITPRQQVENFREILAVKRYAPDKVVLLIGNHDFHYLRVCDDRYSGYDPILATDAYEALRDAIARKCLQACYVNGEYLFTHAGVTKTWCANNGVGTGNIEASINGLFKENPGALRFTSEARNPHGDEICQTPIWVRPNSLLADAVDGYVQVVGHTPMNEIQFAEKVIFIDAIGAGEYLIIEDGVATAKKSTALMFGDWG